MEKSNVASIKIEMEYKVEKSELSTEDTDKFVKMLIAIYKEYRLEINYSAIVTKILNAVKNFEPFCNFGGSLICILQPSSDGVSCNRIAKTYLSINITSDKHAYITV